MQDLRRRIRLIFTLDEREHVKPMMVLQKLIFAAKLFKSGTSKSGLP